MQFIVEQVIVQVVNLNRNKKRHNDITCEYKDGQESFAFVEINDEPCLAQFTMSI